MTQKLKDVSIIIVNYNTSQLLEDCINSIIEKTKDVDYEIVVVDNASSDGSATMLKSKFPLVKLIENSKNLGFGRANNIGAKYAYGEFLFLLNTDTLLINNSIKILLDFMRRNKSVGVCGGNLYHKDLTPNFSYVMNFPSLWGIFMYRSRLRKVLGIKKDVFNNTGSPKKVGFIIGADFFIRKEVFDTLGGFDPEFFMYVEDCELSYRIFKQNIGIYSVPESKIIHLQGKSSTNDQRLFMEIKNYILYFKKHRAPTYVQFYSFLELIFIAFRMMIFNMANDKTRVARTKPIMTYLLSTIKNKNS